MSTVVLEAFVAETRLAVLTTLREDGFPVSVPVWFQWDGSLVRVFTGVQSDKIRRLENDPRATLLVTNTLEENESWVAFDGEIEIVDDGGFELAESLARRYWDLDDPGRRATLEQWRGVGEHLRVLEMRPDRIRSYIDG